MSILRRPGRLAIVLLLLGCAVLVAVIVTVRTASGGSDAEPPLGPAVNVTPTAADTSTPPTASPTATSDDDDDDDATPVSPRSPSAAGDDDQDDKGDDKDDRRGD